MCLGKSLRELGLRRGAEKWGWAVEKLVEVENHFRNFSARRPTVRFRECAGQGFKAMNSNQLCNSFGINMTWGSDGLVLFRF
jgi:hypothetical protein